MTKLWQNGIDWNALKRAPFAVLVAHFARGLFASEQEQAHGGVGFGLGGILALLAIPGALVSLFLLAKYSSLIAFFHGTGRRFNPYKLSIADEYFFVVLSMTIIGLMVVLRWDRLLPNRRDFINLATLPIKARDIFLANLVALLGLAVVFAIDINLVSTVIFPLFVTMNDGTILTFAHFVAAHALTVFSASMFSFFSLFGLVGLLMAILPKNWFRFCSTYIRLFLFVLLLAGFFSNLLVHLLSARMSGGKTALLHAMPGFWFLGVYEQLTGLATPVMDGYGRFALTMLAGSVALSAASYAACYSRHFAKLAEFPADIIGGLVHRPSPLGQWLGTWLSRFLSPSQFEKAVCGFCTKALFRSEQQAIRFGAYLGLGFIWTADTAILPDNLGRTIPDDAVLSVSLLVSFFGVTGLLLAEGNPVLLEAIGYSGQPQKEHNRLCR